MVGPYIERFGSLKGNDLIHGFEPTTLHHSSPLICGFQLSSLMAVEGVGSSNLNPMVSNGASCPGGGQISL